MKKYLVVISIFLASYFGFLKPIQFLSLNLLSGNILFLRSLSYDINDVLIFYSNIENIRKENIRLKSEILTLKSKLAAENSTDFTNNELQSLKNLFSNDIFFKNKNLKFLRVVYYDAFSSRIFLSKSDVDINVGDEVLYGRNLVGTVLNFSSNIVEVKLISDKDFILNSIILNQDKEKIKTITTGELGDSLIIKNILSTENVKEGDLVFTSNTNKDIAPELVVGKIERLEGITSQTFRKATLSKFYDLNFINYLGVLSK